MPIAKSTAKRRQNKPAKPSKDFPLYPHNNGQWAKKVKGKRHYFGPWEDPEGALQKWLEQKDDLLAGRTPRPKGDTLTVKSLFDRFLTAKNSRVASGEISIRTYRDYVGVLQHVADVFGRNRPVTDLAADDFRYLRESFAAKHGPVRLGKDVTVTRMPFKWGYESGLLEHPVRFGPDFKKPPRRAQLKASRQNGRKYFAAEELRRIIDSAEQPLRAMILCGINAGFGQSDVASLQMHHVNLERGWIEYPRPKTEVERRCPLWPETVHALREAAETRPEAIDPADADCVFLTSQRRRYVRLTDKSRTDTITPSFRRLLDDLDINGRRNFYSLRHTFETVAGESRDQAAVDLVMGHSDNSMAANYRHRISDERLRDVVDVVRKWLWPERTRADKATADAGATERADNGNK